MNSARAIYIYIFFSGSEISFNATKPDDKKTILNEDDIFIWSMEESLAQKSKFHILNDTST